MADVRVGVTVDKATVKGYGGRINAKDLPGVRRSMQRRTKRIAAIARATAPVRTGKLKRSIKHKMRGSTGEVTVGGAGVDYVNPVVFGARPHKIRARRVKNLRFYWENAGRNFVGPSVNHPGNRPNPWLVKALRAGAKE